MSYRSLTQDRVSSKKLVWLCLVLILQLSSCQSSRPPFFEIECKGIYDSSIFAKVDKVCYECFNLFREPELLSLCREKCFTGNFYKACAESLQLTNVLDKYKGWIRQLHGADASALIESG